ncbi:MAG: YcxB family protein [Dehalococcoidia bacterium]|jgi:Ca2+/Na+ antiporter
MIEVLSGEYTIQDYKLANRLHMTKSKMCQIMRAVWIALFLIFLFLAAIMLTEVVLWLFTVLCLFYILYPYTILPLRIKRLFEQQKLIHGKIEIRFEGNQIKSHSQLTEDSLKWLHHYVITDKMLLIYTTPRTFIMLPRRFFKDDAQFNGIKDYLHNFPMGDKMGRETQAAKQ